MKQNFTWFCANVLLLSPPKVLIHLAHILFSQFKNFQVNCSYWFNFFCIFMSVLLHCQAGTKGPRQPWHDLHCKVEGPAAYDILTNFEQRWRKATKWSEFGCRFKRVTSWNDDSLIKLERISWILSPSASISHDDPALWVSNKGDPENWHVQVITTCLLKQSTSI